MRHTFTTSIQNAADHQTACADVRTLEYVRHDDVQIHDGTVKAGEGGLWLAHVAFDLVRCESLVAQAV